MPVVKLTLIWLRRLEDMLLALLLTAMISVAAVQVLLRNLFDSGLFWGDSAVRVLVLWVAMIGAMVASRQDEHIRIDIAGRYITGRLRPHLSRLVNLFTCLVLAIFAWSSWRFVQFEMEDQTLAFANVPAWMCEIIMPIGAAVMALRYALQVIKPK